jgi:hypothetical protein
VTAAENTTIVRISIAQHNARMAAWNAAKPWRAYMCELSRQLAILFPDD